MSNSRKAALIFNQWKAELVSKDRTFKNVLNNFDDLFYSLFTASVPFDEAHNLIKDAVSEHMFSKKNAEYAYGRVKRQVRKSFEDFTADWKKGIEDKANQAFFNWYQIEESAEVEKRIGGMTPQEYTKYRRYVNSFPQVDIKSLKEQSKAALNSDEDFDLGDLDG